MHGSGHMRTRSGTPRHAAGFPVNLLAYAFGGSNPPLSTIFSAPAAKGWLKKPPV
jgi:hypothetical protein